MIYRQQSLVQAQYCCTINCCKRIGKRGASTSGSNACWNTAAHKLRVAQSCKYQLTKEQRSKSTSKKPWKKNGFRSMHVRQMERLAASGWSSIFIQCLALRVTQDAHRASFKASKHADDSDLLGLYHFGFCPRRWSTSTNFQGELSTVVLPSEQLAQPRSSLSNKPLYIPGLLVPWESRRGQPKHIQPQSMKSGRTVNDSLEVLACAVSETFLSYQHIPASDELISF